MSFIFISIFVLSCESDIMT